MQLSPRASYHRRTQKEYSLACGFSRGVGGDGRAAQKVATDVWVVARERGGDAKLSRRIGGPQNYYGRSGERVRRDEIAFASQIHSPLPKL